MRKLTVSLLLVTGVRILLAQTASLHSARLEAEFSGGAVTARTSQGLVGLRLVGYGNGELHAEGARVEYRRSALTEWYVNEARGLEQGFTLHRRLAGPIELAVSGDFVPRLADGAVEFERGGRAVLRYDGLRAWDADGRSLPARLEVHGKRIAIAVDDVGSVAGRFSRNLARSEECGRQPAPRPSRLRG